MANKYNVTATNVPRGQVTVEAVDGKISLDQIENGKYLEKSVKELYDLYRKNVNPDLYRKMSDYILTQDLDPSLKKAIDALLKNYDNLEPLLDDIEYDGHVYKIKDVLILILDNMDKWSTGQSTVTRI